MGDTTVVEKAAAARRKRMWRIVQGLVSLVVVVLIFALVIPKVANYSDVWATIRDLTLIELASVVAVMVFNLFTYWLQIVASMPGLTVPQAAVNNQSSTTIANILPGGGAIAVGVSYMMYRSWGFPTSAIVLSTLVTGIWNIFLKLGLPVIALALLAIQGDASAGLLIAAVVGVAVLAGAVALFALALWKKEFARRIGAALGRAASFLLKLIRKPSVKGWDEAAVRFRRQTIQLLAKRWVALTVTTIVSHLALYLVLLVSLRHVGVSERELSSAQILGVFALGRLVSAIPITPGGLGVVEITYIGGLTLLAPEAEKTAIVAAVLLFRTLTYAIQIPLGGLTYIIWRAKRSWRKEPPPEADVTQVPAAVE